REPFALRGGCTLCTAGTGALVRFRADRRECLHHRSYLYATGWTATRDRTGCRPHQTASTPGAAGAAHASTRRVDRWQPGCADTATDAAQHACLELRLTACR